MTSADSRNKKSRNSKLHVLAWLAIAVVFVLGYVLWLVPAAYYNAREWIFPLAMIPLVAFALFVAVRQRRWGLGVLAILAIFAPVIALAIGWLVVIVQERFL